jgi:hypothetical protein
MKHDEFETQMFTCVNKNCQEKEMSRQAVERAAYEEYRYVRKCKKINAGLGVAMTTVFFGAAAFGLQALTMLGIMSSAWAIGVMAIFGLVCGMIIACLGNRIKN